MRADRVIVVVLGPCSCPCCWMPIYGGLFALVLAFMLPWAFAWALLNDVEELKSNINRRLQALEQEIESQS